MVCQIAASLLGRILFVISLSLFVSSLYADTVSQITHGDCSPAVANVTGNVDIFCGSSSEVTYWNAISESENISDFESYLSRYPSGKFNEIAENKITKLKSKYKNAWGHLQRGWEHIRSLGIGGDANRVIEQHKRAEDSFLHALSIYPKLAYANFSIGYINYITPDNQNFKKALEYFNRAIDINPNFSKAYLYRGFTYTSLKEYKFACDDYLKFQTTNEFLSEQDFDRFLENKRFSGGFLDHHGCVAPNNHKLGRAIPLTREVKCDQTFYLEEIKKCALDGHENSMYRMGDMAFTELYKVDDPDRDKHASEARKWFGKLVAKNNPLGFFGMGEMYSNGWGIKQDCKKAFDYYTIAAEAGIDEAQFSLGHMYLGRECVERSISTARKWFVKAAVQGNVHAASQVENIDSCPSNPYHYLQPCHD